MQAQTFIILGRSGCGKGTQAKLLKEYLQKKDANTSVFYLETGAQFREFIQKDNYTSKLSKEIYDNGGLQPEFLAVSMWSELMIANLKGGEHFILDGTPRKLHEAQVLDSALRFYKREKPFFIFLNVSREWSEARLTARQRSDDTVKDIKVRLDWYDTHVAPAVYFFRDNPNYRFLDINGEQSIELVHEEIVKQIM